MAVEHIHHAPVLSGIYRMAERRWFDPYDIGRVLVRILAAILWGVDRVIDWLYDGLTVGIVEYTGRLAKSLPTGDYSLYIVSSFCGSILMIIYLLR